MKCIKLNNQVTKRVSDNEADRLVSKGLAKYISKEEYKKITREPESKIILKKKINLK